jgi:hypothetical protein
MKLKFPPIDSPVRALLDIPALIESAAPGNRLHIPDLRTALWQAREAMQASPKTKTVHTVCWRADGALQFVRITPRRWKRLWLFGK